MDHSPKPPKYAVNIYPDVATGGRRCWVAQHPDLPGCVGYGDTVEEAKQSLDNARTAYLTHLAARGRPFPAPSSGTDAVWGEPAPSIGTADNRFIESGDRLVAA